MQVQIIDAVTLDANGEAILDLRKVRDYERRNANRKSVLDAVEAKLASG